MEKELDTLQTHNEVYWKQRSRMNWLAYGDRNSKVFHMKASERRRKNKISGLFNNEGIWFSDSGDVLNIVQDYFQTIFSSSTPSFSDLEVVLSCVRPRVTRDMNEILLRPFSGEDVRKALMDMHPTKSPGPDGFPAIFFQNFWNIIGSDIIKAALHILNEQGDVGIWNSTLITLIPKVKEPKQVKDFRPISLCNVLYKIVYRAITNCFRLVLDEIIGDP
ncbi:hypothetical protein UlMin_018402 [Ulmus minor]